MNMNTDELDSPNNSNNEHLDKTANDATSKTEDEDSNKYYQLTQKNLLKNVNSDQIEQTSIGDEESTAIRLRLQNNQNHWKILIT